MPSWAWGVIGGGGLAIPVLLMCVVLALRKGRAETGRERANSRAANAELKLHAATERHLRKLAGKGHEIDQCHRDAEALTETIAELRDDVEAERTRNASLLKLLPADQRAAVAADARRDLVRRIEAESGDDRDPGAGPDDAA